MQVYTLEVINEYQNIILNSHINRISQLNNSRHFCTQMNTKNGRFAGFLELPVTLQRLQWFTLRMTLRSLRIDVCKDAPGRIITINYFRAPNKSLNFPTSCRVDNN